MWKRKGLEKSVASRASLSIALSSDAKFLKSFRGQNWPMLMPINSSID